MVAGPEEITSGVIRIDNRVVDHVPSRDRDIAMVFRSYALYPHLSAYDNIAFGLEVEKVAKKEIEQRVQSTARILGLEPLLERKPRALSGGRRQHVAMGRSIVRQPKVFLMDVGRPIEVAVDTRSLHFFDPHTGLGIYDTDATHAAR